MRHIGGSVLAISFVLAASAAQAAVSPGDRIQLSLPQSRLDQSLTALSQSFGEQIIFSGAVVRSHKGRALNGRFTSDEAMRALLRGSGFRYFRSGAGVFVVVPDKAARSEVKLVQAVPAPAPAPARAVAQAVEPAAPPAQEEPAEEIVVTGSRLIRTDLSASSPVTTVGNADIRASGNVTMENTLNQFPQLASGNTSSVGNGGGNGVLSANLRGLGNTRTLVLVNGRRFIPANSDGVVDLTTIPDALVDRVDIVTGGASAVYGSDAIAGAVNFMLKRNFKGIEADYQYQQTTRGDGFTHKADIIFGADLGSRGNVTLSAGYTKRDPIYQASRGFASVPLDTINGELVPGGSSNIPGTRITLSAAQRASLVGVDLTPNGPCTAISGIRFGDNGTVLPYCNPESAYNYQAQNILQRPLTRTQITGLAHYEVADHVEAYGEVYYINARNGFSQSPDSFAPVTPGAPSSTLLIPNYATNQGLLPTVRQFFVDNQAIFDPNHTGTASVVGAGRTAEEIGPRVYTYERSSIDLTGGLRGDFAALGHPWKFDAFFQYQRNRTDTRNQGQTSQTRLSLGLDTVLDANGNLVCRTQILGCVPVNIFGLNTITPEAAAYLTPLRKSNDVFKRTVAGGSISGELFDLPAGPVALALGTEYRRDEYAFEPSPQDIAGEYGTSSQKPVSGSYHLWEVFGETRLPILKDVPLANTLALEAAARYSKYSTVGGVFTWKIGGEYAPISWVRFRSEFNRAIRAPTINELFAATTIGFSSGVDPCVVSAAPSAQVKAFCVTQGVPAGDIDNFQQANVGLSAQSGGNPNLKEERSNTFTAGVVVSPPFLRRLNLTVDYFKVKVDDAIARINANQTLLDCYTNLDPSAPTCASVHRLSNGQIDFVETRLANIGALKVEGIDAQVDYRFDLPGALSIDGDASLSLQAVASWLFERSTRLLSGAPLDCAGRLGGGCTGTGTLATPSFKLFVSTVYNSGPVSVRLQAREVGAMDIYPGFAAAVDGADAQWYFDLSGTVKASKTIELFGGINNLFDKDPPILGTALAGDANTDPALYDVIGRRFFVGARVRF